MSGWRSSAGNAWGSSWALLAVAFAAVIVAGLTAACQGPVRDVDAPRAIDGVLDLRGWTFDGRGTVSLDGQWQLAWGERVPPGEPLPSPLLAPVPAHWSAVSRGGEPLPGAGRATYRLILELPEGHEVLALQIPPIRTAFRLYVNGREAAGAGELGEGSDDVEPAYAPTTVFISAEVPRVELTVHVANEHHRGGGLNKALRLGAPEAVLSAQRRATGGDWLLGGAIFVMGIYHLGLFAVRRRERAPLWFAIYCLLICARLPLTGELLFYQAFPTADLRVMLRVEYMTFLLGAPAFCLFLASLYPRTWHRRALRLLIGISLTLAALFVFVPLPLMTRMLMPIQALFVVGVTYAGYTMARAIYLRLDGAGLFAAGFVVQSLTTFNDVLYFNGLSSTGPWSTHGTFVFVIVQSVVLSRSFASAYTMAESYASTFRKFVPTQFLRRIAKDGLASIRLGNVEAVDISILFSDIRSFASISERLTPNEVFAMLNRYLSRMEPPIQAHGGFVDKYIGDAIMALFDLETRQAGARGAIEAALGMLDVLEAHNAELAAADRPPILTGIGIHSGEVMIGTVGSAQRMDSTAIGDAVNLAARIEGMTKMYGADLLISEDTLDALGPERHAFVMRFVDRVRVKGKRQPVEAWQVLGRAGDPRLAAIEPHLPRYAMALERYLARDFPNAAHDLELFLEAVPDDIPAALHLDRCRQFADGVDSDWDGVVSLQMK